MDSTGIRTRDLWNYSTHSYGLRHDDSSQLFRQCQFYGFLMADGEPWTHQGVCEGAKSNFLLLLFPTLDRDKTVLPAPGFEPFSATGQLKTRHKLTGNLSITFTTTPKGAGNLASIRCQAKCMKDTIFSLSLICKTCLSLSQHTESIFVQPYSRTT